MTYETSPEGSRRLESSEDTPALSECSISHEQPGKTSQEDSRRFDSQQDTPTLSEIFLSKEQPGETSEEGSRRYYSAQDTPRFSEIFLCKEQPSPEACYVVKKFEEKDDAGYVTNWKDQLNRLLPFSSSLAIAAYWLYFAFRVRYTVAAQELGHTVYPVAWLFLSIETGVALPVLLTMLLQCLSIKPRHRSRLRVIGDHVPMVDVLITCAGEEPTVILDTVRAAADVDWPRDRMRIIVLDDKKDEEVRREVQLLGLTQRTSTETSLTEFTT